MRLPSALAALLFAAAPASALEGGSPASPGDRVAGASVAIQAVHPMPDGRARIAECTGVLIAPDLVLTAAHCLDEAERPEHVAVFFFAGAKAVPPFAAVAAIARHGGHTRGWATKPGDIATRQSEIAADLAILRLAAPAPAGHAPLPSDPAAAPTGLSLAATGIAGPWGRSGTLKHTALADVRPTKTGPRLAFATPVNSRVCRGDSGGPVVTASGTLWGIAGAILRGSGGCAARVVTVPFDPTTQAAAAMIRMARGP